MNIFCTKLALNFDNTKKKTIFALKLLSMAKDWDIIITNKNHLWTIDIKGLWHYRDLLSMYVKRDIVTFYKQTILGPLWFVIQPLFTTIMFMFVFSGIDIIFAI